MIIYFKFIRQLYLQTHSKAITTIGKAINLLKNHCLKIFSTIDHFP